MRKILISIMVSILALGGVAFAAYKLLVFPEQILLVNAALVGCRNDLHESDRALLLPEWIGKLKRESEMQRESEWTLKDGRSRIDIITAGYESFPHKCRVQVMALVDRYIQHGANIDERNSKVHNMTSLQTAIMFNETRLACALLKRGASLDIKIDGKRYDGSFGTIHGLTLYEYAKREDLGQNDPARKALVATINRYLATGSCAE